MAGVLIFAIVTLLSAVPPARGWPPPLADPNLPPTAANDVATTPEDAPVDVDVMANDSDPEGAQLFFVDPPVVCVPVIGVPCLMPYLPPANFCGTDVVSYTISDGANTATAQVAVTVSCVPDAPTDIALSAASVAEFKPANTVVGTFSSTDPDAGDTFVHTLVPGAGSEDNASFHIVFGNTLRTSRIFDFGQKSSYSIRVRSTDTYGLWLEEVFTIAVLDGGCTFAVAPTSVAFPASPDMASVAVTTQAGCAWAASESLPWAGIESGAPGVGSGAVQISATANATSGPRSGSIVVAGTAVTLDQAAQPLTASFVGVVGGAIHENPYGPAPLDVVFDASGSRALAAITNYHWVFGDGATADTAGPSVAHRYLALGSYAATLTVTAGAETDSAQRLVTVADLVHEVATAGQLQAALTAAQANGKHDLIRIAAGTYLVSGNGASHFAYLAGPGEDKDLVLEGGWTPDFSQRASNVPSVLENDLDGPQAYDGGVLSLDGAANGTTGAFVVDGLTLRQSQSTWSASAANGGCLHAVNAGAISLSNSTLAYCAASGAGGGLLLESSGGGVWVSGNRLRGNEAATAGAGRVSGASAYVSANVVRGNGAASDAGLRVHVAAGGELIASNNTIYNNSADSVSGGLAVDTTGASGTTYLDVHNNLFAYNLGNAAALRVVPDCAYLRDYVLLNVVNNDLESTVLCTDYPLDSSNVSVVPWFLANAVGDDRLRPSDVALIDAGTNVFVPAEDFEGDAVPLDGGSGAAVADIGADEYDPANPTGPTAVALTPAAPTIALIGGSATLTATLDHPAKRDLVLYVTHDDTNTDSPGAPLATVTPPYLKILKGAVSAEITVQAESGARHGTTAITASDPSGTLAPASATATVSIDPLGPVTLVSPAGVIGATTPVCTWNALARADAYLLWIGTGTTTLFARWYTAEEAHCAAGTGTCWAAPTAALPPGPWYFNVKAKNAGGAGPWTTALGFTIATIPSAPTLVAPGGTIATATPTYRWSAQPGTASYLLWVGTGSTTAYSRWYTAAESGCGSGAGECSATPATSLAPGAWFFNVRGKNAAGTGPWAAAKSFVYSAAAAPTALTLGLPSGAAGTSTPTYTWTAQAGVDSYQLWVGTGSTTAVAVWYPAAAAGCGSGTGTCSVTPSTPLATGAWFFNVRGKNAAGTGPWASAKGFTTP